MNTAVTNNSGDDPTPPAGQRTGFLAGLTWRPAELLANLRAGLQNPHLIGRSSYQARYRKVQWCMNLWRFLVVGQILILILLSPQRVGSVSAAYFVFGLMLVYTVAYAWLSTHTRFGDSRLFHALDLLFCAALFFISWRTTLLFSIGFYTYASLMSRPVVLVRQQLPGMLLLSFSFLASIPLLTPGYFPTSDLVLSFLYFYIWGFGFVGYANILARVSALEMEGHLEEQRSEYRRLLHDDLGNTLCGLHFSIQRLGKIDRDEQLRSTLDFLRSGYDRAAQVLKHLLSWFEEPVEPIGIFLREMIVSLREQFGVQVQLQLERDDFGLSPEVKREVLRIIREAATNALLHSGCAVVVITAAHDRWKIRFQVRDAGCGIDADTLAARQATGSLGVRNMHDRAAKISGDLDIATDDGTCVTLSLPARKRSRCLGRILDFDATGPSGGLYQFLIRIKLLIFLLILSQAFFLNVETLRSAPVLTIMALLCAENLVWFFFPDRLLALLRQHPSYLIAQQVYIGLLFYLGWRFQVLLFFIDTASMIVIMNAFVLGFAANLKLTLFQGAAIMAAYFLAFTSLPATSDNLEILITKITSNLILALTAGLAVEFVKSLEMLQVEAVTRALARQRGRLSTDTHRQLHSRVRDLSAEISTLLHSSWEGAISKKTLAGLEQRSNEIKIRLRTILASLEQPPVHTTIPELLRFSSKREQENESAMPGDAP
ncbi:MAG: sensor histidine kinase [Thermoleophilia bacterium]